jgi:CPA2 family monovalent cation:H+ antiporter-2/glutathione-regulated potassium-efflux system ancillary protein KefC/glutathione-regulated potassium-efflux system protein KefB
MYGEDFFYQAFIYLAAAVISVPIAKKLGLGSVLGYLIAGVIVGPFVLKLVGEEGQDVMHFAEFGVVMMLFLIGLELKPTLLWKLRTSILGLGASQVGASAILIMAIALISGLPWQSGLAIGLTLALSSTAIVLQTLNEKNLTKTEGGQSAFSVLLFQDIAVIPILAIIPLLTIESITHIGESHGGDHDTWITGLPIVVQTLIILGAISSIILAGRYFLSPLLGFVARARVREIFTAAALLLVVGIALLMNKIGLSPALGTFLAGVVLAQSEYRHELETDIEPFKGLLLGLFFIAVGASIDFKLIFENYTLILILVFALIFLKFLVLFIIGRIFKMKLDTNLLFTFSLAQGGEFAFVLFSYSVQNQVIEANIANLLISVVAVTMALTPLLMIINERLILPHFGTLEKKSRPADAIEEQNKVIIAGFGRMGSVTGRFLQANNIQATYLDTDPDNVDFLRRIGLKVFYGDASRRDLLSAAGAKEADLIIVMVDDPEEIYQIVTNVQKHFPNLRIMTRTKGWRDSYEMIDLGVEHIYRETFDTALRMGVEALSLLGFRKHQVHRASVKFRKHDEETVRDFAKMRKEKKDYVQKVKLHFERLESVMLEEMENSHKNKDLDWDNSSLIQDYKERKPED